MTMKLTKASVAIAVAQTASASYKDGVWFVALSSLADPDLVLSALTAALGSRNPAPTRRPGWQHGFAISMP